MDGWNLVAKRKPKTKKNYIVTVDGLSYTTVARYNGANSWRKGKKQLKGVTAWMELPRPLNQKLKGMEQLPGQATIYQYLEGVEE